MLASTTKRKGYLFIPGVEICGIGAITVIPKFLSSRKSLFSHSRLRKHTLYVCKEGVVYVSGNRWLYRLTSYSSNLYGWALDRNTQVWLDEDGNPVEFENVSRVELLFSS